MACLFLGNVTTAQHIPHFSDTSVFLSVSEYTTQLVCICPNVSIQDFLEAVNILCKYTDLCTAHTQKRKRLGWIGSVEVIWSTLLFIRTTALQLVQPVLGALASPALHISSTADSAGFERPASVLNHVH